MTLTVTGKQQRLTAKQQRFVEEYLIDLNATKAAVRAGFSAKTAEQQGYQLLQKTLVAQAIQQGMDARSERTEISADYVLQSIVETMERCKQVYPVLDRKGGPVLTETADGDVARAFTFNAGGVLKGAELLGKHLKMFTDKVELSGGVSVVRANEIDERI